MSVLKKVICIIILAIVIIICGIFILIKHRDSKNTVEDGYYDQEVPSMMSAKSVEDMTYYITVKNCVNNFLNYLNSNNSIYYGYDEEDNYTNIIDYREVIYSMLSNEYIQNNNITIKNVNDYIYKLNENVIFVPIEMYVLNNDTVGKYAVHGLIVKQTDCSLVEEICIIINIDGVNNTYSVEPLLDKEINLEEVLIENNIEKIQKNDYNTFMFSKISSEKIAEEYFTTYKRMILGYPELAYQYLNEEYREKRFGSVDNFKMYIQENREELLKIRFSQYMHEAYENQEQYVCKDQDENYYIFYNKGNIANYTVILDTYTIDLPEFTNKYENGDDMQKVGLNIQKVFEAINSKDYKYVYNVLDETFKLNNYRTYNEFEEYIKNNLFTRNKVEYLDFSSQSSAFIYSLKVFNYENNKEFKNVTVIMQLNEGTDFKMSFNIE